MALNTKNNILVGDINFGNIYYFKLNQDRKSLDLVKGLTDKIAQTEEELSDVVFGHGFGGITDLKLDQMGSYMSSYMTRMTEEFIEFTSN